MTITATTTLSDLDLELRKLNVRLNVEYDADAEAADGGEGWSAQAFGNTGPRTFGMGFGSTVAEAIDRALVEYRERQAKRLRSEVVAMEHAVDMGGES